MTQIVFARIAWHPYYNGKYPFPYTGADWKEKKEGEFGEWQNFCKMNGKYYGYAKPPNWKADLSNFGTEKGAKSVRGITVIWVAPDPKGGSKVVGWYKNAKMYSELQRRPQYLKHEYLFESEASNCVLIDEYHRKFEVQKRFRNLWYAKEKEAEKLKKRVLAYIDEEYNDEFDDPVETDFSDTEGRKVLKQHLVTERSCRLVKKFKKSLKSFKCVVCNFDFEAKYGDIGLGFIEAHHIQPVSSLSKNRKTTNTGLVAVCSNCHRMLHRKVPPYEIEELKKAMRNKT